MKRILIDHGCDPLAERFVRDLREIQSSLRDPFQSVHVVVQNRDTAKWLKLRVADSDAVSANLKFHLPFEWLWSQYRRLHPDLPVNLPSDVSPLSLSILGLFIKRLSRPSSANGEGDGIPFLKMLSSGLAQRNGEDDIALPSTLIETLHAHAKQLAVVFDGYQAYRPSLLSDWMLDGHDPHGSSWQRSLWTELVQDWRGRHQTPSERASLHAGLMEAHAKGVLSTTNPLLIFNPGLLPIPILNALNGLDGDDPVHLYVSLPMAPEEISGLSRSEVSSHYAYLIDAYGEEAMAIARQLVLASSFSLDMSPGSPVPTVPSAASSHSTLSWIQRQARGGQSVSAESAPTVTKGESMPSPDGSIRLHACHHPGREVETLHRVLLELFESRQDLDPSDIVVCAPDIGLYEPYIKSVFSREHPSPAPIPYEIAGPRAIPDGGLLSSFMILLDLFDSRCSREDVVDALRCRPIGSSAGLSPAMVETIHGMAEEHRVMWGLDGAHRAAMGQPVEDIHTWDTLLSRALTGHLIGSEHGDPEGGLLPPDIDSSDFVTLMTRFARFMDDLRDAAGKTQTSRTLDEWILLARFWMERFLSFEYASNGVNNGVSAIIADLEHDLSLSAFSDPVPYSLFKRMIREKNQEQGVHTARFGQGVLFANMVPMRGLPFRVVCLIGLNLEDFPRVQRPSEFDLMARHPEPFDRDRTREDRHLFLEAMLAAGDVFYCSYIGHSLKHDEEIAPSSILTDWIRIVDRAIGAEGAQKGRWVVHEALNGYSSSYFADGSAQGFDPSHAAVRNWLDGRADPSSSEALRTSPSAPDAILPVEASLVSAASVLSVSMLATFYRNPSQAYLRHRHRVRLSGELQDEDEFMLSPLDHYSLADYLMNWKLFGTQDHVASRWVRMSGRLPSGLAGENALSGLSVMIGSSMKLLQPFMPVSTETHPVCVHLGDCRIEGDLTIHTTAMQDHHVMVHPGSGHASAMHRLWIQHLLFHVATGRPVRSTLFWNLKSKPERRDFRPIMQAGLAEELLAELAGLVREGLVRPLRYFPKTAFEWFEKHHGDETLPPSKLVEWRREDYKDGSVMGESVDPYVAALYGSEPDLRPTEDYPRFREVLSSLFDHLERVAP